MVDKYIFMKAKSVRFIAPISYSSLTGSRGMNVREIYEYFEAMCLPDLERMVDSIQPVVTKCPLNDDSIDIDVLRSQFYNTLVK